MTEDEAQGWITERFGTAATDRVAAFLARVVRENTSQNLIAPASIEAIWARHALDSAQLLPLAPAGWTTWLDIGTGGGFPGMVIALLEPQRTVIMAEPRTKRAAFLAECTVEFGLPDAVVEQRKVQAITCGADVISARAVAGVEKLLRDARHCATPQTTWLLPRGHSRLEELGPQRTMFHVEHSVTHASSVILVGRGVPR